MVFFALQWLPGIQLPLCLYVMLVFGHLIGRFYWRNEEKLNWEV